MSVDMRALLGDLDAESPSVTGLVAPLHPADWDRPTAAEGWAIRDQISHLAYFDEAATVAATDPRSFRKQADELGALGAGFPDVIARRYRDMPADELLAWFLRARAALK